MGLTIFDRVTVVIPQWNEWELTANCVGALRRFAGCDLEIIVVDDGSDADAVELSERYLSDVSILKKQVRKGVTKAWNFGASLARRSSEYLVFLNNDVIFRGDWISHFVDAFSDKAVALVGVTRRFEKRLSEIQLRNLPIHQFLEGWCFGVRRKDFEQLNGFDERMEMYWSDTDFQLRIYNAYRQRGLNPIFQTVNSDLVQHLGHRSTKKLNDKPSRWREDRDIFLSIWS